MADTFIPLSAPSLKGNEIKYVVDAITTEWVSTAGPYVTRFEKELAEYVGAQGAVACQSGTAGIHLALLASEVGAGDAVIVPALTFIAAVNPVRYVGAEPIFMDCDESLCMDPCKLADFCDKECVFEEGVLVHKGTGLKMRALIVVHVFGNMADMERITEICRRYNIMLVEDATEALGTKYLSGEYAGRFAGTIGDVGVFSFNGNKIMTTGGGGMIVADNRGLLERARHLSTQAKADAIYFEHDEIGYNYRMTNLQAALGIAQLEQLDDFIAAKNRNHGLYEEKMRSVPGLRLLGFREDTRSNKWFYSLLCEDGGVFGRDELIGYLSEHRIQSRPIWGIVCDQKPYSGSIEYDIEKARWYRERVVNVPCSTNLSADEIEAVVATIKRFANEAE